MLRIIGNVHIVGIFGGCLILAVGIKYVGLVLNPKSAYNVISILLTAKNALEIMEFIMESVFHVIMTVVLTVKLIIKFVINVLGGLESMKLMIVRIVNKLSVWSVILIIRFVHSVMIILECRMMHVFIAKILSVLDVGVIAAYALSVWLGSE